MIGSLSYQGMLVQINDIVTKRLVPVRVHSIRDGEEYTTAGRYFKAMRYHNRIQKKWNKRFGTRSEYQTLCIENRILVMHSDVFAKLKAEGKVT